MPVRPGATIARIDLAAELPRVYESEINVSISWLWDGGFEVRLGDEVNGFLAEETFAHTAGILPWLEEAIAHFYPDSTYTRSLSDEVRSRAAQRLFQASRTNLRVYCPRCGAPHAPTPGIEELVAFVCDHCGASVALEPPKT